MDTKTEQPMDIEKEMDRVAWVPTKITELTRKGVKRPLEKIAECLNDEQKKKMGRFTESKLQEIAMNLSETEIKEVEQKVEVAVNGVPKTVDFRLDMDSNGHLISLPREYVTDHLDDKQFVISLEDGLVEAIYMGNKRDSVMANLNFRESESKSTPFPSVIKIKNNKTNEQKALKIRKLIEAGHTAKAFLIKNEWQLNDKKFGRLKLKFGRTVEEDLKHVPEFERKKQAQAFYVRVRNGEVNVAEFRSRLTTLKLEEWNRKEEEILQKLMHDFVGHSHYCFDVDSWLPSSASMDV